jgi:hypothetical protein
MANPFDLSTVEQDDSAEITLLHPSTGDELEAKVIVFGQDSEKYRNEQRKLENKFTEYARRNRGKMMPAEQREGLEKAKNIACTKEIINLSYKGEAMTDPETVFTRFPWVYDQTVQGIHERANFIKGSSTI